MQIDVFTLFPDWFGWFEGQRHVANARPVTSCATRPTAITAS
jgi:hypothetical protein